MNVDIPLSNITPTYADLQINVKDLAGGVYVVKVYDIYGKTHVEGLLIKQ